MYPMSLSQSSSLSNCLLQRPAYQNSKRDVKRETIRRPQILPSAYVEADCLQVFVLSDLHTDYHENMTWVKCLSAIRYKEDVLIVAGDVAETYKNFVLTMSLLKEKFKQVFFVPGNHDLWCRWEEIHYVRNLRLLFRNISLYPGYMFRLWRNYSA